MRQLKLSGQIWPGWVFAASWRVMSILKRGSSTPLSTALTLIGPLSTPDMGRLVPVEKGAARSYPTSSGLTWVRSCNHNQMSCLH